MYWAAETGVVNGVGNGKFAPNATLSLEQLITILYRYAENKGYNVSKSASLDSFTDGSAVSAYARPAMQWAVGMNFLSGNTLTPGAPASRAQIALEYDRGVPEQAERTITELFSGGPVLVKKRTKSGGEAEFDLTPMIFGLSMRKASAQELELTVLVSAQNPSCNPQLLVNAIERYLPEQKPDFARIKRLEIYDEQGNPFR